MKIKIISNMHSLDTVKIDGLEIELCKYPQGAISLTTIVSYFVKSFRYNYILLDCAAKSVFILAWLHYLFPFNRCRIISVDCILRIPVSFREKILRMVKSIVFKKVHIFLEFFKNTKGYEQHYHIKRSQLQYVPFKINSYELVLNAKITDDGYIFCGGKTLRDFETLIQAMKNLPYRLKIVTKDNDEILQHGSFLDESKLLPNIEVVRHDGNPETFTKLIAASRFAVLPILKKTIAASGIGVYIVCMALKKCVVISSGPSADDILSDDTAVIVPPEDTEALKQAIIRASEDHKYRERIARNGYEYAIQLKGQDRLKESILQKIHADALTNMHIAN